MAYRTFEDDDFHKLIAALADSTTVINNTKFVVIPSSTQIPISDMPLTAIVPEPEVPLALPPTEFCPQILHFWKDKRRLWSNINRRKRLTDYRSQPSDFNLRENDRVCWRD